MDDPKSQAALVEAERQRRIHGAASGKDPSERPTGSREKRGLKTIESIREIPMANYGGGS